MAYTIAVSGKGGTGKTTLAALFINYLLKKNKGSILAIDADPNANLAASLGVKPADTVVSLVDEISKNIDAIPKGMTKERYIEYQLHDILSEHKKFDLLVMGRPEGPGCYCYVNNLLRGIIEKLTRNYSFVVIDNEGGMEHLSRRIERAANTLTVVSDYTLTGIRSAGKILSLAREMEIKFDRCLLVVNRVPTPIKAAHDALLKKEIDSSDFELVNWVPEEGKLGELNIEGRPVSGLSGDLPIIKAVDDLCEKLIE